MDPQRIADRYDVVRGKRNFWARLKVPVNSDRPWIFSTAAEMASRLGAWA